MTKEEITRIIGIAVEQAADQWDGCWNDECIKGCVVERMHCERYTNLVGGAVMKALLKHRLYVASVMLQPTKVWIDEAGTIDKLAGKL